jgi:hypothetical protein
LSDVEEAETTEAPPAPKRVISEPGLYSDLSMDEYHGHLCDPAPSVSASGLWRLLSECPAKFWESSAMNPDRVPEKKSTALDVGKAAHALVLGEPEFNAHFLVCPHDNLSKKPGYDWNKEWKAAVAAGTEKRTLVRKDDFADVKQMAAALRRSPQVGGAFSAGKPEQSFVWLDAETGVYLKSRPDWLPNDPASAFLQDYKTALTVKPRKLSQKVFEYGYHVQAAMQVDAVEAVLGVKPLGIAHVCQEKDSPYLAELRMFTAEQIDYGRRLYRRALHIFAVCWHRHQQGKPLRVAWPGYTDSPQYFETPYYIRKEMEEDNGDGTRDGFAPGTQAGNDDTQYPAAG